MIADIHHAQVTVPGDRLDEAIDFYGDVLELPRAERPTGEGWRPRGAWFTVGTRQLHIGVEDDVDRAPTRAHVAYEVTDLATYAALLERLRAAGKDCQTDDEPGVPPITGWKRFQSRDPFGNQIEFVCRDMAGIR